MKTIEITQPQNVLAITEPAQYVFAPEAICNEIFIYASAAYSHLLNPVTRAIEGVSSRGIGWEAQHVTIENMDCEGHEYGAAPYTLRAAASVCG